MTPQGDSKTIDFHIVSDKLGIRNERNNILDKVFKEFCVRIAYFRSDLYEYKKR
jgi:hypothetical protein